MLPGYLSNGGFDCYLPLPFSANLGIDIHATASCIRIRDSRPCRASEAACQKWLRHECETSVSSRSIFFCYFTFV